MGLRGPAGRRSGLPPVPSTVHLERDPADAERLQVHFMKTSMITLLLQIAGILHLGLIGAGAVMPKVVDLRAHLAALPGFIRQLFWVYYSFIGLCLVSFGCITFIFATSLTAGSPLARALCVFLAAFWTLRLVAATFIFDVTPYLTDPSRWLGYHATNLVFIYLPIVYLLAAWKGGGS
jgi:hypothetical protein